MGTNVFPRLLFATMLFAFPHYYYAYAHTYRQQVTTLVLGHEKFKACARAQTKKFAKLQNISTISKKSAGFCAKCKFLSVIRKLFIAKT